MFQSFDSLNSFNSATIFVLDLMAFATYKKINYYDL